MTLMPRVPACSAFSLLYTGERFSEPLRASVRHLNPKQSLLYISDAQNGEPRPVHMPPVAGAGVPGISHRGQSEMAKPSRDDAGVPFLERSPDAKLFRFTPSGYLRDMLKEAMHRAGLSFPPREGGFHIFCHTYGTWMTRYGSLDTEGLFARSDGRTPKSAAYAHTIASPRPGRPIFCRRQPVENPWKHSP